MPRAVHKAKREKREMESAKVRRGATFEACRCRAHSAHASDLLSPRPPPPETQRGQPAEALQTRRCALQGTRPPRWWLAGRVMAPFTHTSWLSFCFRRSAPRTLSRKTSNRPAQQHHVYKRTRLAEDPRAARLTEADTEREGERQRGGESGGRGRAQWSRGLITGSVRLADAFSGRTNEKRQKEKR